MEQERLVLLLKTLRDIQLEKILNIWGSPMVLWKSLPLLGSALTEHVYSKICQFEKPKSAYP